MFCKECGNQISDDSKFCAKCGKMIKPENNYAFSVEETMMSSEIKANDELLRALIGKNPDYYLQQFAKIERGEKSFNLCAFLFGSILTLYRKQYAFFMKVFLPAFILPIFVYIINFCLYAFARPITDFGYMTALYVVSIIYSLAASVFCGITFNKTYMKQLRKTVYADYSKTIENKVTVERIKPSASTPTAVHLVYIILILVLQAVAPSTEQLAQSDYITINGTYGMKTSAYKDSGDEYIEIVKDSTPSPFVYIDTNKTYGEAFEDFFSSTKWEYLGVGTLEHFLGYQAEVYHAVNFTGKAAADGEEVTVQCRFEAWYYYYRNNKYSRNT